MAAMTLETRYSTMQRSVAMGAGGGSALVIDEGKERHYIPRCVDNFINQAKL